MLNDWSEKIDSHDDDLHDYIPRRRKSGRPSAEIEMLTARQVARFTKRGREDVFPDGLEGDEDSPRERRKSPRYDRSKRL